MILIKHREDGLAKLLTFLVPRKTPLSPFLEAHANMMDTPDDLAHAIPSGGEQRRYQRDPVSLLLALRAAFFGLCASTRMCREV